MAVEDDLVGCAPVSKVPESFQLGDLVEVYCASLRENTWEWIPGVIYQMRGDEYVVKMMEGNHQLWVKRKDTAIRKYQPKVPLEPQENKVVGGLSVNLGPLRIETKEPVGPGEYVLGDNFRVFLNDKPTPVTKLTLHLDIHEVAKFTMTQNIQVDTNIRPGDLVRVVKACPEYNGLSGLVESITLHIGQDAPVCTIRLSTNDRGLYTIRGISVALVEKITNATKENSQLRL